MLKKLTAAGVLAAAASGVMLLGTPADAGVNTSGRGGVLSGNQVFVPITVPVNVCGNAIAVIGRAGAGCRGGASVVVPRPSGNQYCGRCHRHHHHRRHCR